MRLYHYRSIESALKEIGNCTFHFSTREELNDPIEGYVSVYWQGDKAAWEGMFKNYICSLSNAIDLYLLRADENLLRQKTLIIDLHRFDDVPLGTVLQHIGNLFLNDKEIQKITAFYGNSEFKVCEEELRFIFHHIHNNAMIYCLQECGNRKIMPKETVDSLLRFFSSFAQQSFPFGQMDDRSADLKYRAAIVKSAEYILEDMIELFYMRLGSKEEDLLYGCRKDENSKILRDKDISKARQQRNWMTILVDFPRIYIEQIRKMIYPESYVVCFSGRNNNSAMWGNYADQHQGVCLIYETDDKNRIPIKIENKFITLEAKPVEYGGDLIERNFFESFGRLNVSQIRTWLTGTEGLSHLFEAFNDLDRWREKYQNIFEAKSYRKLKAWEYENEYRIIIDNMFYIFDTPESRNLKYDTKNFKGVIFGINTSEYDKHRIMEQLLKHADEYGDLSFYQAEYDGHDQEIRIREKKGWKLR